MDALVVYDSAAVADRDLVGAGGDVDHVVGGLLEVALPVEILGLDGLDVVLVPVGKLRKLCRIHKTRFPLSSRSVPGGRRERKSKEKVKKERILFNLATRGQKC